MTTAKKPAAKKDEPKMIVAGGSSISEKRMNTLCHDNPSVDVLTVRLASRGYPRSDAKLLAAKGVK